MESKPQRGVAIWPIEACCRLAVALLVVVWGCSASERELLRRVERARSDVMHAVPANDVFVVVMNNEDVVSLGEVLEEVEECAPGHLLE